MIPLDEALGLYIEKLRPLGSESVAIQHALQRVLKTDAFSQADLPRFDQSAMDGYVFRAADTDAAPTRLTISSTSSAGSWPQDTLKPGTAWRIFTGAPVPEGADTVIPQERIEREGDELVFTEPYPPGRNIRYRGEEIQQGTQLATAGQRLTPGLIASLCNAGIGELDVQAQPKAGILITGDEVRPPGSALKPGEICDSNGPYIRNWLLANGYVAPEVRYVSDSKATVLEYIDELARHCEVIITAGGASVGDRDFIPEAARELGFEEIFWKVAQKPGKPLFFGLRDNQPLLGLPGNPGAVLVGMEVHTRTVLDRMQGMDNPLPHWMHARLDEPVAADEKRDRLLRMRWLVNDTGENRLLPLGKQDSHMLSNLGQADALAWLPSREQDYEPGEVVRFLPLSR